MPNVTLSTVTADTFDVLHRLMQLYLYDFSVYFCDEPDGYVDEDGLFDPGYDLTRYLYKPGYTAYLARTGERWAGFSLISERADKSPTRGSGRNVDEFFVLRCFRRQGIGRSMAHQTFDTFRGFWQVMQIAPNTDATTFWRRAIDAYTGGRYTEFRDEGPEGEEQIWQTFDTGRRPR